MPALEADFNSTHSAWTKSMNRIETWMVKGLVVLMLLISQGCSVTKIGANIPYGVLNNDDMETVRDGLPTFLLLIDGVLETYPESASLLNSASSLNGAYAGVFVTDPERKKLMTNKSLNYAFRALCAHNKKTCNLVEDKNSMKFEDLEPIIKKMKKKKDLPYLYGTGSAWVSYIQLNTSDWNAIADLAKVQMIIEQQVSIDETYENGMGLLFLGALNSLLPPALGGKPDVAKDYFDRAIEVSDGKNLIVKVMYAQMYARLLYERELHDRLLNEVLEADPKVHGLTLQNVYAQSEAKKLLESADEYF